MAFPVIADQVKGSQTSNSTSWTLTYPSGISAGDLLLVLIGRDGSGSTWDLDAAGFTLVDAQTDGDGSACAMGIFAKEATGSESGNFTFSTTSEQGVWLVLRITGWYGGSIPSGSAPANHGDGLSTYILSDATNSPSSTPIVGVVTDVAFNPTNWDVEDTLWLAASAHDGTPTYNAKDSNYTYVVGMPETSGGSNGAGLAVSWRNNAVASENPGNYGLTASEQWVTAVIAIRPEAAGNVTVTPTTLAVVTARFAPTVTATNHQSVTPSTASLTLSAFAPVIRTTVTPTTASLSTATFAPTVSTTNHQLVTPTTASLTTATFAPTVTTTAHQTVTPTTASLSLSAFAPSANVGINVVPTTASLTLSPFAPTVSTTNHQLVTPDLATLSLATFAPTVATPVVVTPTVASLSLSPFAPTVTATDPKTVTPTTAALTLTTFAPVVTAVFDTRVTPTTASLATETFAPTVSTTAHQLITPTTLSLSMTAFAPTVVATDHKVVTPSLATLSLLAFNPDVVASDHQLVTAATAALVTASYAPNVRIGAPGAEGDLTLSMGGTAVGLGARSGPTIVVRLGE
jgi:hypothetical protein